MAWFVYVYVCMVERISPHDNYGFYQAVRSGCEERRQEYFRGSMSFLLRLFLLVLLYALLMHCKRQLINITETK